MITLSKELRQAIQESEDYFPRLVDPETNVEYVILSTETFLEMQAALAGYKFSPLTKSARRELLIFARLCADWKALETAIHNDRKRQEAIAQGEDLGAEPINRECNTEPSPDRSIPEEAYSPAKFKKSTDTLDDLLAQVTEDNLPDETNADPSVENEE